MSYMCGKCGKTRAQLIVENKLNLVQGYEQCVDCHGDLDHESIFKIRDMKKKARQDAIDNDDYITFPTSHLTRWRISKSSESVKVPNVSNYYPQWYRDHLSAGRKRVDKIFKGRDRSVYANTANTSV